MLYLTRLGSVVVVDGEAAGEYAANIPLQVHLYQVGGIVVGYDQVIVLGA